jgi:hypothetical protein
MDLIDRIELLGRVISSIAGQQGNTNTEDMQTSMPRVVFEPTIQVFERAKKFHAFDRVAKVIGAFTPVGFKYTVSQKNGYHFRSFIYKYVFLETEKIRSESCKTAGFLY